MRFAQARLARDAGGRHGSRFPVRGQVHLRRLRQQAVGPADLEPGERYYEERIMLWQADSAEIAIALAEAEANEYAETLESEYAGLAQSYRCSARSRGRRGGLYPNTSRLTATEIV